jgi:hypothetical protein
MSILLADPLEIFRYPIYLFPASFLVLALSAWIGARYLGALRSQIAEVHEDYRIVEGATLTLLALIIGFTFSMALTRYDQRKNLEEEEANAIGTEYLRADVLPADGQARVRALLPRYLDQRILFYTTRDERELAAITTETNRLQNALWSVTQASASAQPNAIVALAVSGMNDVLNSQGYTQAAWLNRIPIAAWTLMFAIAVCSTILVALGAKDSRSVTRVHLILPLIVSIAFSLIADIDSPRRGMIRVTPQNLLLLSTSLQPASPASHS